MSSNKRIMRSISLDTGLDKEKCNECNIESIENECNKCGNGICKNKNCGWLFPHKYNSMYTICDGCYKSIENKLINYNHLIIYKFLKKNVRRRRISC